MLFIIKSAHDVHIDHYEKGQQKYVNYYQLESKIEAETVGEAVKKYFDEFLNYSFDEKKAEVNEDGFLNWDVLVNSENEQVTEKDQVFNEWKKDEAILYNNYVSLKAYALREEKIKF